MWPEHPDDEWVEVTPLGTMKPTFLLAHSGAATAITHACDAYVAGQISVEELERRMDEVLGT